MYTFFAVLLDVICMYLENVRNLGDILRLVEKMYCLVSAVSLLDVKKKKIIKQITRKCILYLSLFLVFGLPLSFHSLYFLLP